MPPHAQGGLQGQEAVSKPDLSLVAGLCVHGPMRDTVTWKGFGHSTPKSLKATVPWQGRTCTILCSYMHKMLLRWQVPPVHVLGLECKAESSVEPEVPVVLAGLSSGLGIPHDSRKLTSPLHSARI